MGIVIRKLTAALAADYFDFFDHRAFADGSPYYPCYCNAFNMSRERIQEEFYRQAERYGGGQAGWQRALRESAQAMVANGELQGYLAYDGPLAVGWCNANDRCSYRRVGEFDLSAVPPDEPEDGSRRWGQVKSVVCFEIEPGHRGRGIATMLLEQVIADARAEGYTWVEAYPPKAGTAPTMAFTGPMSLYEKLGFEMVQQTQTGAVMRRLLTPPEQPEG